MAVALLVKKGIEHVNMGLIDLAIDSIGVQIKTSRGSILVSAIYQVPNNNLERDDIDDLDNTPQILVGDLNNKSVRWNNSDDLDNHRSMAVGSLEPTILL